MDWTMQPGSVKKWTLDADPSYLVEWWGLGAFVAYHDGERLTADPSGQLAWAKNAAEAAYQAEPFRPRAGVRATVRRFEQPTLTPGDPRRELVYQATGTLTDADSTAVYFDVTTVTVDYTNSGLEPEAFNVVSLDYVFLSGVMVPHAYLVTEVGQPLEGTPELYRQQVSPDMAIVADGGAVVLDVTCQDEAGRVVRHRVVLSNISEFTEALFEARRVNVTAQVAGDRQRAEGLLRARQTGRGPAVGPR